MHNLTPRTTATSETEGRMKIGISKKKKRKILRSVINKQKYGQDKK